VWTIVEVVRDVSKKKDDPHARAGEKTTEKAKSKKKRRRKRRKKEMETRTRTKRKKERRGVKKMEEEGQ